MGRVEGKVVLITGGTAGIGFETAKKLSLEGATVAISGRRSRVGMEAVDKIREVGGAAYFVKGDISKEEDVRDIVLQTVEHYGRLDCAINNASTEGGISDILDLSLSDWERVISTTLTGTFLCIKYQAKAMKGLSRGGSIVNIGSVNSFSAAAQLTPYTVSKHGLLGLTRAAAQALYRYNIRVNTVCPGVISTEMHCRLRREVGDIAYERLFESHTIMKRIGNPEEIALPVLWLCSDESSYMTGTEVVVDGGYLVS